MVLNQKSTSISFYLSLEFLLNNFAFQIVYYFNSEDKFPKELRIPNCDSPCSLTNFGRSIEHLLVDDYDEICGAIS